MRPLSATECITPAIEHTKALLRPFSLKLWLKLGLVAFFAEMGGQFIASPVSNFSNAAKIGTQSSQTSGIGALAGSFTPVLVVVFICLAVLGFLLGLTLLYLGSRLQLVLMDLVATRSTLIAPAWRRTATRTWRWIGLKVVSFLVLFAIVGAIAAAPIFYFIRSMPKGNAQPTGAFVGSFLLFFFVALCAIMIILIVFWALRDFVLPFILFNDASFGDAFRSGSALIRNEPGPVLFYLFMKLVLSIVVGIAAELCIVIALLVAAIPTGLIGAALYFALHTSGPLGTAIMYISFALLGVVFVAALIVVVLCIGGPTLILYQAYALYFMGGRLPNLGNLLEPPLPPYMEMPIPPPPFAPA